MKTLFCTLWTASEKVKGHCWILLWNQQCAQCTEWSPLYLTITILPSKYIHLATDWFVFTGQQARSEGRVLDMHGKWAPSQLHILVYCVPTRDRYLSDVLATLRYYIPLPFILYISHCCTGKGGNECRDYALVKMWSSCPHQSVHHRYQVVELHWWEQQWEV